MRIQTRVNRSNMFGVTEPIFEFTFLADPYQEQLPITRLEEMTAHIRQTLSNHYHFGLDDPHTFSVEFYPLNEIRFQRQTSFGRIGSMTSDVFFSIFTGMLQSNESLTLDGMRINVQLFGARMNHQVSGRGRTLGSNALPDHLKNRGLIQHPWASLRHADLQSVGLCGILSLLLLKDEEYTGKLRFTAWVMAAQRLGEQLGIRDGVVKNEHFEMLLQQEGWRKYRIVIFSINRSLQFIATGDQW